MIFSELSLAEKDSGLTSDAERLALIGTKNGFGVVITDNNGQYTLKVYAETPFKREKAISDGINLLSESLSKNTIGSQRCEYNFVEVCFCKSCLLQEKLILLIDFLDKLTELMRRLEIKGLEPVLPEKLSASPIKKTVKKDKIRLSFDFGSVKGLFGALVAVFAMTFISSALVRFEKGNSLSPLGYVGAYISSGAAAALIFFDYRFLAKKLDPFGVIICPVLSVLTAFLTSVAAAAKSAAYITETTFTDGFSAVPELCEADPEFAAFVIGYFLESVITAVLASVIICVVYFNKYPDEMIKSEKNRTDNPTKK